MPDAFASLFSSLFDGQLTSAKVKEPPVPDNLYLVSVARHGELLTLGFSRTDPALHGLTYNPPPQSYLIIAGAFREGLAADSGAVRAGASALLSAIDANGALRTSSGSHLFIGALLPDALAYIERWKGLCYHPSYELNALRSQLGTSQRWSRRWKHRATILRLALRAERKRSELLNNLIISMTDIQGLARTALTRYLESTSPDARKEALNDLREALSVRVEEAELEPVAEG